MLYAKPRFLVLITRPKGWGNGGDNGNCVVRGREKYGGWPESESTQRGGKGSQGCQAGDNRAATQGSGDLEPEAHSDHTPQNAVRPKELVGDQTGDECLPRNRKNGKVPDRLVSVSSLPRQTACRDPDPGIRISFWQQEASGQHAMPSLSAVDLNQETESKIVHGS